MLVFIDGQNLYKSCNEHFQYPMCHPLLLARALAGNRRLVGVRYYSGIHQPRINPQGRSRSDRRHSLIRRTGVTVIERDLKYRTEWGFDRHSLPDPRKCPGQVHSVDVSPYERAREKGIDVTLALDVVDLTINAKLMDTVIILSRDDDLSEVARVVHSMTGSTDRVSVEAAIVNGSSKAIVLKHYDYTHQVDQAMFDVARDGFDYRSPLDKNMVDVFLAVCRQNAAPGCV